MKRFRVYVTITTDHSPPSVPFLMVDGSANGCVAIQPASLGHASIIDPRRPVTQEVNFGSTRERVLIGYGIDHYAATVANIMELMSRSDNGRTIGYDSGQRWQRPNGGYRNVLSQSLANIIADHPDHRLSTWDDVGGPFADFYEDGRHDAEAITHGTKDGETIAYALRWLAAVATGKATPGAQYAGHGYA